MTDRLGGLEVDYKLECGRLLDRQIGGLGAPEYLDDLTRDLTVNRSQTRAISDQAAVLRHVGPLIYCRKKRCIGAVDHNMAVNGKKWRRKHVQRRGAPRLCGVDSRRDALRRRNGVVSEFDTPRTHAILQGPKFHRI